MARYSLNPPSLLSLPGIKISLLGDIYNAAAEFYRLAPWALLEGETAIEIRYPFDAQSRIVVLTGAGGDAPGLSAYDSVEDLERLYSAENPLAAGQEVNWLSLTYDTDVFIADDDLKAIEEYGWPVENEVAYPGIVRLGSPDVDMYLPATDDLNWLEVAISALIVYFQGRFPGPEMAEQALDLEIDTRNGLRKVFLRIPASGITQPSGG